MGTRKRYLGAVASCLFFDPIWSAHAPDPVVGAQYLAPLIQVPSGTSSSPFEKWIFNDTRKFAETSHRTSAPRQIKHVCSWGKPGRPIGLSTVLAGESPLSSLTRNDLPGVHEISRLHCVIVNELGTRLARGDTEQRDWILGISGGWLGRTTGFSYKTLEQLLAASLSAPVLNPSPPPVLRFPT